MKKNSYWDEAWDKYWDKAHEKNPNIYKSARITIYAPEKSDLHEITLFCIKILYENGAWDFETEHIDDFTSIVTFKYNGTITALNAISELHFHCKYSVKWNYIE